MQIVGMYSFNGGLEFIRTHHQTLLEEVTQCVQAVDATHHRSKTSKEKAMPGKMLYSPKSLNVAFRAVFEEKQWQSNIRIKCDYPTEFYIPGYVPEQDYSGAFREMDFVKDQLGVEVQFGKYAFMVYNVCAKMTIFKNHGFIHAGIEIVPVKEFANDMSTGVSYFEQFVWDLQQRGVSDIDIPVLILGIK
ncbi:MAG: restriction endonuclease [Anaerolineae bacterium]|nr:restriction endonuclease [Anaerolineae bacterium]